VGVATASRSAGAVVAELERFRRPESRAHNEDVVGRGRAKRFLEVAGVDELAAEVTQAWPSRNGGRAVVALR